MNNAEAAGNRLVVILNDNDMSIAPPVAKASEMVKTADIQKTNFPRERAAQQ